MQNNGERTNETASLRGLRKQRGVALVAVMLTLLLVTAMAAAVVVLSNTETSTSSNFSDEQRAYFSAKAGIEEARDRMRSGNSYTIATSSLPATLPGGTKSVLYITNPLISGQTVTPWGSNSAYFADDEICSESAYTSAGWCNSGYPTGSGIATTISANSTFAPTSGLPFDWKWVRITLKQSNEFGSGYAVNGVNTTGYYTCLKDSYPYEVISSPTPTSPCATPAYLPVYVLTALAVTPSGSRRMVQAEIGQDTFQFNADAALTLDGTGDSFATGKSENFGVNGNDSPGCGVTTTTAAVPAIGVPSPDTTSQVPTLITQIDKGVNNNTSKEKNIQGAGSSDPDVEAVTMPNNLSTATSVQGLISTIKSDVTTPVINGNATDSNLTWCPKTGSCASQIVYVNGNLTLTGGGTFDGILVVTGTLTMKGSSTLNGLVFVVGAGGVTAKGTDTVNGALIVANTSGGTLGAATMDVSGGGSTGGVNYSSGCIAQATQLTTYHVISFRELMR